jgi:hypothetical protein
LSTEPTDLRETSPGEWSYTGQKGDPPILPGEEQGERQHSSIDDIPSIGTPVEFFALLACLFLLKLLA